MGRINVDLARAGGSDRVGLQRLGTPSAGKVLTVRNVSYDPTFFAYGSKTYTSFPNYLNADQQATLQRKAELGAKLQQDIPVPEKYSSV